MKWTELYLGPIQRRLEAFLGFLVKTKMKAYKKLTVVMCCQIVGRKSVAPSSGDFRRQGSPQLKIFSLIFLFSKNLFFWNIMVTCDEQEKVSSSQNVLLSIFLKIRNFILRYGELNRLLVGLGQIPLNIELQQDDRTVWCSHTVVEGNHQHEILKI